MRGRHTTPSKSPFLAAPEKGAVCAGRANGEMHRSQGPRTLLIPPLEWRGVSPMQGQHMALHRRQGRSPKLSLCRNGARAVSAALRKKGRRLLCAA